MIYNLIIYFQVILKIIKKKCIEFVKSWQSKKKKKQTNTYTIQSNWSMKEVTVTNNKQNNLLVMHNWFSLCI